MNFTHFNVKSIAHLETASKSQQENIFDALRQRKAIILPLLRAAIEPFNYIVDRREGELPPLKIENGVDKNAHGMVEPYLEWSIEDFRYHNWSTGDFKFYLGEEEKPPATNITATVWEGEREGEGFALDSQVAEFSLRQTCWNSSPTTPGSHRPTLP